MGKKEHNKQHQRAEAILKVRSGLLSATDAARALGVSRKTYYEWEKKGLAAMMDALTDGQGGRPSQKEDPQLKRLREERQRLKLENELLAIRLNIQQLMAEDMPEIPLIRKSKGYKTSKKNA